MVLTPLNDFLENRLVYLEGVHTLAGETQLDMKLRTHVGDRDGFSGVTQIFEHVLY